MFINQPASSLESSFVMTLLMPLYSLCINETVLSTLEGASVTNLSSEVCMKIESGASGGCLKSELC